MDHPPHHDHHHDHHPHLPQHHLDDNAFRTEEAVHQTAAVLSQLVALTGGRKVNIIIVIVVIVNVIILIIIVTIVIIDVISLNCDQFKTDDDDGQVVDGRSNQLSSIIVIIIVFISIVIIVILRINRWLVEAATSFQAAPTFSSSAAALGLSR